MLWTKESIKKKTLPLLNLTCKDELACLDKRVVTMVGGNQS